MMRLDIDISGSRTAGQQMTSPCVYLDNCALTDIAENLGLRRRFQEVLTRRAGTLAISWLNLLELSGITESKQLEAVAEFLDEISYEHIFFIDVLPERVISREDDLLQGRRGPAPHVDDDMLRIFVTIHRESVHPLSFREFIPLWRQDKLAHMAQGFLVEVNDNLKAARDRAKLDTKLQARLKEIPKGRNLPCATRYIVVEALRTMAREGIQMTSNHWRDAFHMIVPIAYCDLVVLDRAWAAKAKQVIARLQRFHKAAMAQVFAKAKLKEFWQAFDI